LDPAAAAEDDGGALRVERLRRRRICAGRGRSLRRTPMIENQRREGYYDYPVIRRPVWTWELPACFWLGGVAGGAYLTAPPAPPRPACCGVRCAYSPA